uniref:Uncharacterized protein n=1 Tax=Anopheles culicifacies TaxID=139723 RepID=A0A182LTE9_9DIPT
MGHPGRMLLLALVLSLATIQWTPVAAFDDLLDDIFSIFFDSDSESESAEPINVNGKHAIINVTCDNCTLTINCPKCNSMSTVGGMLTTVSPPAETSAAPPATTTAPAPSVTPPAPSAPPSNGDSSAPNPNAPPASDNGSANGDGATASMTTATQNYFKQ